MNEEQARAARTVALIAGGGLFVVAMKNKLFPPEPEPGGHVDPAPEDTAGATMTATQATTLADGLEVAFWGTGLFAAWTEDEAAVVEIMTICQNTADVRLLMNAYGQRGSMLDKMNLTQSIREFLSTSDIMAINADYRTKAITINF